MQVAPKSEGRTHLYDRSYDLIRFLDTWEPSGPDSSLEQDMLDLSRVMADKGYWGNDDANMLKVSPYIGSCLDPLLWKWPLTELPFGLGCRPG